MTALLDDGANPNTRVGKKLWFRAFGDHLELIRPGLDGLRSGGHPRGGRPRDEAAGRARRRSEYPAGGDTALMVSSGMGWAANFSINAPDAWLEATKYCVQLGADVNAVDAKGYTALHGAAYIGNQELIQYLVDKGADVKAVAKDKNTVADMANGPNRFGIPHPDFDALLSWARRIRTTCRSDQYGENLKKRRSRRRGRLHGKFREHYTGATSWKRR